MPSMGHPPPEDGRNSEPSTHAVGSLSAHGQGQSTLNQDFRRVSISQLLNEEGPHEPGPESDQGWLLKEILRRL